MYRLLVVDDEPIIADGICEIFQGMAGMDLDVCRAYSAREALDWLHRTRVDLVISDIRMPEMDGLQLLSEIRRNWPECHVIFLTGYGDFNSLYTASQYKVAYLLKSEGYGKLIETVRETLQEMEEQLNIRKRLEEARAQLGLNRQLVFREMLQGREEAGAAALAGLPVDTAQSMMMAAGRCIRPQSRETSGYSAAEAVCAALEQFFGKYMDMLYTQDHEGNVICLLQKNARFEADDAGAFVFVRETLESVQEAVLRSVGFVVTFAVSEKPFAWSELTERYRSLCLLAEYFADSAGGGAIVTERNLMAIPAAVSGAEASEVLDPEYMQTMRVYLEGGRQEEFTEGLSRLTAFLRAARGRHNIAAAGAYMSMASLLINHINRLGLMAKVEAGLRVDRLMELDSFADWQEAAAFLSELACAVFDIRSANRTKRAASVIDKVKKYVRENVSGDLSLVRLSDLVHFNPQYLSKLFKDTEGINLIDYISIVRIERAKQMLENPACKVQEVATAVGYSNTANFCRFFRKHTGTAPNEFREK